MNRHDNEQGIEHLIQKLNSRRYDTRIDAKKALILLGEPVVVPLMDAIERNTFGSHYLPYAVHVLGRLGDQRAVDLLIDILTSNHVHAAQEAAEALGFIGDPRAIAPLIHAFRLDWDDEETITTWQKASQALAAFGQRALPALLNALQDEESTVREGVIDALGEIGSQQAVPDLLGALDDTDISVIIGAIEALGSIRDQRAIEPLITLLKDKDQDVRLHACYALGDIGTTAVFDPLVRGLDDPEPRVRSAALVNLGRMMGMYIPRHASRSESETGPASAEVLNETQKNHILYLLRKSLKDVSGIVCASAARVLGEIGDERVLPDLLWVEQNNGEYAGANKVKDSATHAIQLIQERSQKQSLSHRAED